MFIIDFILGREVRVIDHCPPSLRGNVFPTPYRFGIEISDMRKCYVSVALTEKEFNDLRFRGVEDNITISNVFKSSQRYLFIRIPKWAVKKLNKKLENFNVLKILGEGKK
jgi:hypothetical protein